MERHDAFERPPGTPWSLWAPPLAFLASFVLAGTASAILVLIFGTDRDGDAPPGVLIGGNAVSQFGLAAFAVFFAWVFSGRWPRPADFGLRAPESWRSAASWAVVTVVAFYAISAVYAAIFGIDEAEDIPEQLGAKDSDAALVAVALFAVVVAPVVEEFFFRGFLFGTLWRRVGVVPGVVVTGGIFGLAHAFGSKPEFLFPLALFGALLCLLYVKTGSLYPCIAVHLFNNAIALGVSLEWSGGAILATLAGGALLATLIVAPASRIRGAGAPLPPAS